MTSTAINFGLAGFTLKHLFLLVGVLVVVGLLVVYLLDRFYHWLKGDL